MSVLPVGAVSSHSTLQQALGFISISFGDALVERGINFITMNYYDGSYTLFMGKFLGCPDPHIPPVQNYGYA